MASPFDYINDISSSKNNGVEAGRLPPEEINCFIINRGLSLFPDTILWAQEMNIRPEVPAAAQFHFLHAAVQPKKKRFSKWPKKLEEDADLRAGLRLLEPEISESELDVLLSDDILSDAVKATIRTKVKKK